MKRTPSATHLRAVPWRLLDLTGDRGWSRRSRLIASFRSWISFIGEIPEQVWCDLLKVLTRHSLPLAPFGGAPYRLDETGVVKCVFKAGCSVGTSMQIAQKMNVDLSNVHRRARGASQ
jgi:hypothetical protein